MFQRQAEQLEGDRKRRQEQEVREEAEKRRKQEEHKRQLREARRVKPPAGAVKILPNTSGCLHFSQAGISASPDVADRIRVEYRDGGQPLWYIPSVLRQLKMTGGSYHVAQL